MTFAIEFTDTKELISVESVRFSDITNRMNITAPGSADYVFAWGKWFISHINISGVHVGQLSPAILPRLRSGVTVGIKVRTPNGDVYSGNVGIDQFGGQGDKGKSTVSLSGVFTGRKNQDSESPLVNTKHGIVLDIHEGASHTIGFQDKRADSSVRVAFMDGLNDTPTLIPDAIHAVVKKAGGNQHGHPSDETLKLMTGTGRRFDHDSAGVILHYGRGPRDCSPAAPSVTVGYEETRMRATFTPFGDGETESPICASLVLTKTIKVQVPILSIRIPCVWDGPDPPVQPHFVGHVSSSYTLFGTFYDEQELRFDGCDFQPYEDQDGIYYVGTIRFVFKPGGWKSFAIGCVYPKQLPLEGNQTQHSYSNAVIWEQYYKYPMTGFAPLSEICPRCYPVEE